MAHASATAHIMGPKPLNLGFFRLHCQKQYPFHIGHTPHHTPIIKNTKHPGVDAGQDDSKHKNTPVLPPIAV
jgi:hypothetical protein